MAAPHPERREWTEAEIAEKLEGYLEVPRECLDGVKYGAHVRYFVRGEGGPRDFRPGGFVRSNPFDTKPRGEAEEKRFIRLQNGFSDKAAGYASWLVAYEDIDRLYLKSDAQTAIVIKMLERAVDGLNVNINKIADFARPLAERLDALERAFERAARRA